MLRTVPGAALAAALLATPAASPGAEPDPSCTRADQALSARLRVLASRESVMPSGVNEVMNRMALARIDCKRGRAERGLRTYAQADADLTEIEAVDAAFASDPAASRR